MVFTGEPKDKNGNYLVSGGKERCPESNWKIKLNKAKEKGAKAVFLITENYQKAMKSAEHKIESRGFAYKKRRTNTLFLY